MLPLCRPSRVAVVLSSRPASAPALHVVRRQFTGEFSIRPSVAGSYQLVMASRREASAGSFPVRARHASSNGPPGQRIGIHWSGVGAAKALTVHDSKTSAVRRASAKAVALLDGQSSNPLVYASGLYESVIRVTTVWTTPRSYRLPLPLPKFATLNATAKPQWRSSDYCCGQSDSYIPHFR